MVVSECEVNKPPLETENKIMATPSSNSLELEPFRRAAKLGCKDFKTHTCTSQNIAIVGFIIDVDEDGKNGSVLPSPIKRWNRYAADVCECWWKEQSDKALPERAGKVKSIECQEMIDLCREFKKKYEAMRARNSLSPA